MTPRFSLCASRCRRLGLVAGCLALGLVLQGWLLVGPATTFAESDSIRTADSEVEPHLVRLGVKPWFNRGYRGRGMTVAILDSGFRGYRSHLGKHLPSDVQVRSFRKDGNLEARASQHGILCAEVVHRLAPEATLLFANWEPDDPDMFLRAVRWARQQGAQVVTCSCIMPGWSDGEGGGAIHEELAKIIGSGKDRGDLLFFGCAGNTAKRHWRGTFQPDQEGFHQWDSGKVDNQLRPWGDDPVSVHLYCRPGAVYCLTVHDPLQETEIARATTTCAGERCTASVRFQPGADQNYQVRIRLAEGKPGPFHIVALHSGLDHSRSEGSICFPGDGRRVVSVGATDTNGRRQAYSACGPNSRLLKPDLVAPVPFPSRCRARPFAGTSAATPQAAGLAALLWSSCPHLTAARIQQALVNSARDIEPPGHDWQTGYGLVNLVPPE